MWLTRKCEIGGKNDNNSTDFTDSTFLGCFTRLALQSALGVLPKWWFRVACDDPDNLAAFSGDITAVQILKKSQILKNKETIQ